MADLLAALSLLPPDVNRFSYVAEYLRESFILINPLWYARLPLGFMIGDLMKSQGSCFTLHLCRIIRHVSKLVEISSMKCDLLLLMSMRSAP